MTLRNSLPKRSGLRSDVPISKSFFKRHAICLLPWLGGAAIIIAIGWGALFHSLHKHAADSERFAHSGAAALARSYSEQLSRMLEAVDQTILHVRFEWDLTQGSLQLESAPDQGLFPPTSLFFAGITDAEGDLITSTIPDNEKINVADRPYFKVHLDTVVDTLYMAPPVSGRGAGTNVLQFSRRISGKDGRFQGILFAAVAPSYLTSSYDTNSLGGNGMLGIVGNDRTVRVTRIGATVQPADMPALRRTPHFSGGSGSMYLDGREWFVDGRSRFLAWETVKGYPLIATVGLDEEHALAAHSTFRRSTLLAGWTGTGIVTLLALAGAGFSLRLSSKKYELERTRSAYRMATEDGNDGFFIARPVSDERGEIQDFEVVDCNQRGAEFFKMPRSELVGQCISRSPIGAVLYDRRSILMEAFMGDSVEAELRVPEKLGLDARWLKVKGVLAEQAVAITLHDVSESKEHHEELARRSLFDALTGLPNRQWFDEKLPAALETAAASAGQVGVIHVDLDGFKVVNDTAGRARGDELLRAATDRLRAAIRPQDAIARASGDEWIILLERLADGAEVAYIAERIVHAFKEGFALSNGLVNIGASVGISLFPRDARDAPALLQCADVALFSAKTSGKGTYRFYDEGFYEKLRFRVEMEAQLRQAIEEDQFVMYYQPRIDIRSGETSSMESLIRWKHPERGIINPIEFVPLAEETGQIVGMGTLVIDKVCRQIGDWKRTGQPVVPVSINVSPRQFSESDVVALLSTAIERYDIHPSTVEVEVTEASMMGSDSRILNAFSALQAMGVKLLVDDFGTGYSSLSQLQRMDFDFLKVDRSFTCEVDRTKEGNVFVKAIITMAHALGMRVVAEGVENERQLVALRMLGCDEIQGYFVSRPLPPMERQPVLADCFSGTATCAWSASR